MNHLLNVLVGVAALAGAAQAETALRPWGDSHLPKSPLPARHIQLPGSAMEP